jgi:hypothetical protein
MVLGQHWAGLINRGGTHMCKRMRALHVNAKNVQTSGTNRGAAERSKKYSKRMEERGRMKKLACRLQQASATVEVVEGALSLASAVGVAVTEGCEMRDARCKVGCLRASLCWICPAWRADASSSSRLRLRLMMRGSPYAA